MSARCRRRTNKSSLRPWAPYLFAWPQLTSRTASGIGFTGAARTTPLAASSTTAGRLLPYLADQAWSLVGFGLDQLGRSKTKSGRLPPLVRRVPKRAPPRQPTGWDRCDADALEKYAHDQFAYPPYHYSRSNCVRRPGNVYEPPDAEERELLMDVPLRHTITLGPT